MKRYFSFLLAVIMVISISVPVQAVETEDEFQRGAIQVEYSDTKGTTEQLNIMVHNEKVYADAEQLCTRLGYTVAIDGKELNILSNIAGKMPRIITYLFDSTKVCVSFGATLMDNYEAPFSPLYNDDKAWVPLHYTLLLLDSNMLIVKDTLLISIPQKNIVDIFFEIGKQTNDVQFDFNDDFGYGDWQVKTMGASSHLVNVFNGMLSLEGDAWLQMFQQVNSYNLLELLFSDSDQESAYDTKYGKNFALLFCSQSDDELESMTEQMNVINDIFEGELKDTLSELELRYDVEVDTLYKQSERLLDEIKKGNPAAVTSYNQVYQQLEKAWDKQTWFSNTGGVILDIQRKMPEGLSVINVLTTVADVVGYTSEFAQQDEFSVQALESYLRERKNNSLVPKNTVKAMNQIIKDLKGNVLDYSASRIFKNKLEECIQDGIGNALGSTANIMLLAWDLASNFIPYISDGLNSVDSFELSLYSFLMQADSYIQYQKLLMDTLNRRENVTAENLYLAAEYCYAYLKSCYITREAALASLDNLSEETKELAEDLFKQQADINKRISQYLVSIKRVTSDNKNLEYGFLPADNKKYLKDYSEDGYDKYLLGIIHEPVDEDNLGIEDINYSEVLNQYEKALANHLYSDILNGYSDDWNSIGNLVNMELLSASRSYKNYGYKSSSDNFYIYYALSDINNDNINELFIGAGSDIASVKLYDVFSYDGQKPVLLFDGLGGRTKLIVYNDNSMAITGSSCYNCGYVTYYNLPKRSCIPVCIEEFRQDLGITYYVDSTGNQSLISREQYDQAIRKSFENIKTFSWILMNPQNDQPHTPKSNLGVWKERYINYIEKELFSDYCLYDSFEIVYLDEDDVPEIFLRSGSAIPGEAILWISEDSVYEKSEIGYGEIHYYPKRGILCTSWLNHGNYSDSVYSLSDGEFKMLHRGRVLTDWDNPTFINGEIVSTYEWDEQEVNKEQYENILKISFDRNNANIVQFDKPIDKLIESIEVW